MICKYCKSENVDDCIFCTSCGKKIKEDKPGQVQQDTYVDYNQVRKEQSENNQKRIAELNKNINSVNEKVKSMDEKKLKKIKIASISILLIVIVFAAFITLTKQTQEKVVDKFEEAIISKDNEAVRELLVSKDKSLEITSQQVDALFKFYEENPSQITKDAQALKLTIPNYQDENTTFGIMMEEGFINDKYKISVNPRYIQVSIYDKNIKATLMSGEEVIYENLEKTNNQEIGPFLPGLYTINISANNEYSKVSINENVDIFNGSINQYREVDTNINQTIIKSEYEDAIIHIGGESTEKTAKEFSTIAGLKDGTKIHGVINRDGEIISSEIVVIEDSNEIYLEFDYKAPPTKQEAEEGIKLTIENYLVNFASAVNYGDLDYIEDYMVMGSEIQKQQEKSIPDMYERDIYERYIDHEVQSISYDEKAKTGTINVNESYDVITGDSEEIKTYNATYSFKYVEDDDVFRLTKLVINK